MPNPLIVPVTPPRVAVVDPRTGMVSREWYMFFLSLHTVVDTSAVSLDDVQKDPCDNNISLLELLNQLQQAFLYPPTQDAVIDVQQLMLGVPPLEQSPPIGRTGSATTSRAFLWDESTIRVTTSGVTITLPKATVGGADRTVIQDVVGSVTVAPASGDTIILPAGSTVTTYTKGSSLTFRCVDGSTWGVV